MSTCALRPETIALQAALRAQSARLGARDAAGRGALDAVERMVARQREARDAARIEGQLAEQYRWLASGGAD